MVKVFCIRREGGRFGEGLLYQKSAVVKVFCIRTEGRCFGEGLLYQE